MLSLKQGYKYNNDKISLSLSITGLYIQQNKIKGKPLASNRVPPLSQNLYQVNLMVVRKESEE